MNIEKSSLFQTYSIDKKSTNTGCSESQVALFTERIKHLTGHLKKNKKDQATRFGLLRLVGKRRKLLNYLKRNEIERYRKIVKELSLRG